MLAELEGVWKSLAEFAGLAAATALIVLLPVLMPWLRAQAARLGRVDRELEKNWEETHALQERQEIMWRGQMARGRLEATRAGYDGRKPLSDDVKALFAPILPSLRALAAEPVSAADSDTLALRIEKQHWAWLVKHVCGPLKLERFGCLALAARVARDSGRVGDVG